MHEVMIGRLIDEGVELTPRQRSAFAKAVSWYTHCILEGRGHDALRDARLSVRNTLVWRKASPAARRAFLNAFYEEMGVEFYDPVREGAQDVDIPLR